MQGKGKFLLTSVVVYNTKKQYGGKYFVVINEKKSLCQKTSMGEVNKLSVLTPSEETALYIAAIQEPVK